MASGETTIVVGLCDKLEDLATELVEKISTRIGGQNGAQFSTQCSKKISTSDLKGLVDALIAPLTNEMLIPLPPAQPSQPVSIPMIETPMNPEIAFSLFLVLMRALPGDQIPAVVSRTCEGLTSSTENIVIRARCLSSLYSALPNNSKSRYTVFKALVEYVQDKSAITENLNADQVEALCHTWGESSPEKIRALQLSIADAFKGINTNKSQAALLAYLTTFKTVAEAERPADRVRVRECAINTILDPVASSRDFTTIHSIAVQLLKTEEPLLHQLLEIVCGDSLDKYTEFAKAHPDFLKALGVDDEKTFEKMRLLTLATLGTDSEKTSTYSEVAKALRIEVHEVESWVIKAIAAGVVDAKMDQVNGTVVVHRATQRVFNDEQWVRLSSQLKKWRASVRNVLQTVQSARDQYNTT